MQSSNDSKLFTEVFFMIIISVISASMFQTCKIISYLVGEFQDFMFCLRSASCRNVQNDIWRLFVNNYFWFK